MTEREAGEYQRLLRKLLRRDFRLTMQERARLDYLRTQR